MMFTGGGVGDRSGMLPAAVVGFIAVVILIGLSSQDSGGGVGPAANCPCGQSCQCSDHSLCGPDCASCVSNRNPDQCVGPDCPLTRDFLNRLEVRSIHELPAGSYAGVAMDLPPELRTKNWGGGSCVHASTVNLLKWQGQDEMAEWWRNTYIGGEYSDRLVNRMEAAGLRYAYTKNADMNFLRYCVRTRRGAGIFYKPSHAINVTDMDEQYVYLLDNNDTQYPERYGHYERVPVQEFERRWRGYGGFAWTLIYLPPPPDPVL